MADNHYEVGSTPRGVALANTLEGLRRHWYLMKQAFDAMTTMRDGDGSQASHYALVKTLYGVESDVDAKALYDELNSTLGNSEALLQLLARTG